MSWSWFLRDFLNVGAGVSAVYLFYFGFIPFKLKRWEDWSNEFRRTRFGVIHIAIAILLLRGIVWLIDRYFHG